MSADDYWPSRKVTEAGEACISFDEFDGVRDALSKEDFERLFIGNWTVTHFNLKAAEVTTDAAPPSSEAAVGIGDRRKKRSRPWFPITY